MYSLLSEQGEFLLQIKCAICSLAEKGVYIDAESVMGKCCDYQGDMPELLLRTDWQSRAYPAIMTGQQLISKLMRQASRKGYVALVDCELAPNHPDTATHAIGIVTILQRLKLKCKFDIELLDMIAAEDIRPSYKSLIRNAITTRNADLYQYLQQRIADITFTPKLIHRTLDRVSDNNAEVCACLEFMLRMGVVKSNLEAMALAVYFGLEYETYLAQIDLDLASDSEHHALIHYAGISPAPNRCDVLHRLRIQTSTLLAPRAELVYDYNRCDYITHHADVLKWLLESSDIDCQLLRSSFGAAFFANPHHDWTAFMSQDFVRSCVYDVIRQCPISKIRRIFTEYLTLIPDTDPEWYQALFLEYFYRNRHLASILLPMITLTPEFCAQCQNIFLQGNAKCDSNITDEYCQQVLQQTLGIKPDIDWYIKNFIHRRLSLGMMVQAIKSNPDWNWNQTLHVNDCQAWLYESHIVAKSSLADIRLIELIWYQFATRFDIVRLVSDLGVVELDYDRLRGFLLCQQAIPNDVCHRRCYYMQLAKLYLNYVTIKSLHEMCPEDEAVAEIWHWVQDMHHISFHSLGDHTDNLQPYARDIRLEDNNRHYVYYPWIQYESLI